METFLSLKQVHAVVDMFCANIHDSALPLHIQTTSVKLVNFLTDLISQKTTDSGMCVCVCRVYIFLSSFVWCVSRLRAH